MSGRLAGKITLITGGSSGMALATAERFVTEGAIVCIIGRRQQPLDDAASRLGPRLRAIRADAASLDDIETVFATIRAEAGRLDVLYASAGAGKLAEPLADVTPESFDQVFSLNIRGTPGPIDTPALTPLSGPAMDFLKAQTTIGRLGEPAEIASAALFLATQDASFVAGTELFVSGGMGQP